MRRGPDGALEAGAIVGSYAIIRTIGRGGFGITYEGENSLGLKAAIKEFTLNQAASGGSAHSDEVWRETHAAALRKFKSTTQTLVGLKHPNIVGVFDYISADDTGFMFMEMVNGESFTEVLKQRSWMTFAEMFAIVRPIADALLYLHERGVVHRDIKPDNIIVRKDGAPIVIDFGSLKTIEFDKTDAVGGRTTIVEPYNVFSRDYAAPEQRIADGKITPATDIFALASLMYRALTGEAPPDADRRVHAVAAGRPDLYRGIGTALAGRSQSIDGRAATTVDAALSLNPCNRPQNIGAFLDGMGWRDPPTKASANVNARAAATRPSSFSRRTMMATSAAITMAAIGLGGWLYVGWRQEQAERIPAARIDTLDRQKKDAERKQEESNRKRFDGLLATAGNDPVAIGRFLAACGDGCPGDLKEKAQQTISAAQQKERDEAFRLDADRARCAIEFGGDASIAACTRIIDLGDRETAKSRAITYRNRGIAYYRKSDHDRAIADFDEAIRADPQYARAYSNRGLAFSAKGDNDRAIADYDEAIRINPRYAAAYINRGAFYNEKGDNDRAIADYNEGIRLNPLDATVYYNRGNAYSAKGDKDRAIADYNEGIRLNPLDATVYYNRGNAYSAKGDKDRAIADYDEAIRLDPRSANGYIGRGNAYSAKGDNDRAIANYNEALRVDPQSALAYYNRSIAYTAKRDNDRAKSDMSEAMRLDPRIAAEEQAAPVCPGGYVLVRDRRGRDVCAPEY